MKLIGHYDRTFRDYDGNAVISFVVPNIRHQNLAKELDPEKTYSLEIKEVKKKRSIEQNKYMWALINEIDIAINGRPCDDWAIYIMALERAGAKCDYIAALPETEPALKANFRAIKYIKDIDLNGKPGRMYKVFIGSSKMNVKEMNLLIDTVLDIAEEVGIETDYYRSLLK